MQSKSGYITAIILLFFASLTVYGFSLMQTRIDEAKAVYQGELDKSYALNRSLQQSISDIMEENARLKINPNLAENDTFNLIKDVWNEYNSENKNEAYEKLKKINREGLDESHVMMYDMLSEILCEV